MNASTASKRARYFQLGVLVLASGGIYPLLYLRQNFEVSMLEAFQITNTQLGQCYSMLGVLFFLSYLPSGWLADRFAPRTLLTFSSASRTVTVHLSRSVSERTNPSRKTLTE